MRPAPGEGAGRTGARATPTSAPGRRKGLRARAAQVAQARARALYRAKAETRAVAQAEARVTARLRKPSRSADAAP